MKTLLRLTVAQRFMLIVALCAVAILVPALMYGLHVWGDTKALLRERDGLPPARAALEVMRLTQQHRGLSAVWLGGKDDAAAARAGKADEVGRALAVFADTVRADGAEGSALARRASASREGWDRLREDVAQKRLDGATSSARHTELIAQMMLDLDMTLAHWGLVYDPDAQDYHLIVGALQEAPRLIEIMGQMRARGANLLSAPDKATPAGRAAYAMLADNLRGQFVRVTTNLDHALADPGAQAQVLKKSVDELSELGKRGIAYTRQHVVEPVTLTHSSAAFYGETTQVIDAMYTALAQVSGLLSANLQARSQAALTGLVLMGVVVALLFGAALGVAIHTGRWLRRQLGTEPDALYDAATRVARGDLTAALPVRPGDTASVVAAMSQMQQSLARLVGDVRSHATQVSAASSEIAQGNQDLSARTESQASALQQTAASMEELRTTISHSADSARQASQLADQASRVAGRGGASVSGLADSMERIHESSRRIADIIGTIDGIAFQTNILALNAAVEAARAGEQGRGFAVVAGEVRALAKRSADAAREVRTLISDSVERVEQGSRQGNEAAATMQEMVQAIERVSSLIGEVSTAAQEQNTGVAQVSDAVSQMDQATQRNAALVEQSAAAAEHLHHQAQALEQAVAGFRTSVS